MTCAAFGRKSPDPPKAAVMQVLDDEGNAVGIQQELHSDGSDGTFQSRHWFVAVTVDGHDRIEAHARVVLRTPAGDGPRLFDGLYGSGGQEVAYRAAIAGDTATIVRTRLRGDEEAVQDTIVQTIDPDLPLADAEALAVPLYGRFLGFDPATGRFAEYEALTVPQPEAARYPGELRIILRDDYPVDLRVIERADDGAVIGAVQPQPGSPYRFRPLPLGADMALDPQGRVGHPMIESPHTISPGAKQRHIRYRIALARALAERLPGTGQQAVSLSEDGARIDICEGCGPGLSTRAEDLARWTRPTAFLQSDHAPIAQRGESMARRRMGDRRKIDLLAQTVRERMIGVDFNGHHSARAAWQRRSGDCTEDAVLLAALMRASGIPTLVASGLVYSRERYHGARNAFIPHAWVVAYVDGHWISYDMTLEEGFGASHIALTLGEGEASQFQGANMIAGMLEWESLSEVRPRPAE